MRPFSMTRAASLIGGAPVPSISWPLVMSVVPAASFMGESPKIAWSNSARPACVPCAGCARPGQADERDVAGRRREGPRFVVHQHAARGRIGLKQQHRGGDAAREPLPIVPGQPLPRDNRLQNCRDRQRPGTTRGSGCAAASRTSPRRCDLPLAGSVVTTSASRRACSARGCRAETLVAHERLDRREIAVPGGLPNAAAHRLQRRIFENDGPHAAAQTRAATPAATIAPSEWPYSTSGCGQCRRTNSVAAAM